MWLCGAQKSSGLPGLPCGFSFLHSLMAKNWATVRWAKYGQTQVSSERLHACWRGSPQPSTAPWHHHTSKRGRPKKSALTKHMTESPELHSMGLKMEYCDVRGWLTQGGLTLVGDWLRLVWINPSGEVTELARILVCFFDLKKTPSFVLRHYHRNVSGSFVVRLKRTCEFHPRALACWFFFTCLHYTNYHRLIDLVGSNTNPTTTDQRSWSIKPIAETKGTDQSMYHRHHQHPSSGLSAQSAASS